MGSFHTIGTGMSHLAIALEMKARRTLSTPDQVGFVALGGADDELLLNLYCDRHEGRSPVVCDGDLDDRYNQPV